MMTVYEINELNSGRYRGTMLDEDGAPFTPTTLTLTLFDRESLAIINNRDSQDVLNTNQVTHNPTTGLIEWSLLPADNPILDDARGKEEHRARFTATWASGTRQMQHEFAIKVLNLRRLP